MELFVRATVVYWFLWLMVRGTGKRSLAELTPLDMLLIVVLGDVVQQGVTQEDMSVTGALIVVSVFVGWTMLSDAASRRSKAVGEVLDGSPMVILQAGEPLTDRLEQERMTLDDLKEAARMEGYGDLGELEWGILEPDGRFSFIAKKGG
ncbi:MAG TPA: YetF domain-containing protein [Acidimicrobiia bacterium]|jgi:uncharacterized membrane protein YcaP (DUF421 family)